MNELRDALKSYRERLERFARLGAGTVSIDDLIDLCELIEALAAITEKTRAKP